MPAYLRNEKREILTLVELHNEGSNIFYAWNAKDLASEPEVSQSDLSALGHRRFEDVGAGALYVIGAQAPKPGRATKKIRENPSPNEKGSVSTFYAVGRVRELLAAGWKLAGRPKLVSLTNNARTITAIVELSNGLLYCYSMNKTDFETYGALLGLKSPTSINTRQERASLVMSSNFPRPGKASTDLQDGSTFSSFFSSDKIDDLQGANYKIITQELIDE